MITSKDNEKIKYVRKLRLNKYMKQERKFVIEGENLINEAYNSGILLEVYSIEECNLKVDINYVSKEVIETLSILPNPSKIIGVCKMVDDKDILEDKIIILDGISDPGNLGTIIRSAKAFNFGLIVLSNNCVNKYNEKVIRASEGMIFKSNVINKNLLEYIPFLEENGYSVYGTSVVNGMDVKNINNKNKIAVVIGNEGNGITEDVKKIITNNLYINMNEECESLNAAVASSIIMYELSK